MGPVEKELIELHFVANW